MSYQIQYEPHKNRRYPVCTGRKRHTTVFVLALTLLAVCMSIGLRTGWLIPGDPEVTSNAFSDMVTMLREGEGMKEAVTAFCMEILEHGAVDAG